MITQRHRLQPAVDQSWDDSRHKFYVVQCDKYDPTADVFLKQWWEIDHYLPGEKRTNIVGPIVTNEQAEMITDYLNAMGKFDIAHMF